MKNILFIAYEFPPMNRGGVFRSLAFVKFLPEFGYNPVVMTLARSSYPNAGGVFQMDENLGAEVYERFSIEEIESDLVPAFKKTRIRFFLDTFFSVHGYEGDGWQKGFDQKFEEIIRKYKPVGIVATVPPFGILPLVSSYAKKYGLPMILDFRDAWSQWRTTPYASYLHYLVTLNYERKYLRDANAVVVTSKQTKSDFLQLHPQTDPSKIYYIPNGIEGSLNDWSDIDFKKSTITIGYVGSFYFDPMAREQMLNPWWKKSYHRIFQYMPDKQDWLYRTPHFFFKAIRNLLDQYPEYTSRIRIRFAGKSNPWLNEMIKSFNLVEQVELLGSISHKESIAFQETCDLLLITSSKRVGLADYSIAGKTFEYFKMQKPILAFVCEGSQKEILEESGMALICDPDSTESNVVFIKDLFEGRIKLKPDYEFLSGLTRQKLTGQLAEVISSVINKDAHSNGILTTNSRSTAVFF